MRSATNSSPIRWSIPQETSTQERPAFADRLFESLSTRAAHSGVGLVYFDPNGDIRSKTYRQLLDDVMEAVRRLRQAGLLSGMRVGILATNSYEWVIYDLALIKMRCTSVIFPEEFSTRTSDDLVQEFGLSLLLISRRDEWPVLKAGKYTAHLDGNTPVPPVRSAESTAGEFIPSLVFSSGTEGAMKCMKVDHDGLDRGVRYFAEAFQVNERDSLLVFLPLSSNQQRAMVYAGIQYGYQLQLISFRDLARGLRAMRPTLLVAPPLFYEMVHAEFESAVSRLPGHLGTGFRKLLGLARNLRPRGLSSFVRRLMFRPLHRRLGGRLRVMLTGMAPIKSTTLHFYEAAALPLYQVYGLTEVGPIAMNTPTNNVIGTVGRPVDPGGVTIAEDGEILVHRERFIVNGYVGVAEDVSRQTFIDDHTVATGDIGRFDEDGNLHIVGRKKQTIVLRSGYKVNPETIEGLINVFPNVDRSVVFGSERAYLTAVISMRPGHGHDTKDIRASIQQMNKGLPERARIVEFVLTEQRFGYDNGLLTRSLKLNRKAIEGVFQKELDAMYASAVSVFSPSVGHG